MSEVVRTRVGSGVRVRTRRGLDERLFVRWPRVYALTARALLALPPRSKLRRAQLPRHALSGWSAWARGDLDLMLVRYAPDCEYEPPSEFVGVGMRSPYRGHAGLREMASDMRGSLEGMDLTPREIVDAGTPIVILGDIHYRGRTSGVESDSALGSVLSLERGLVVRQRDFLDWDEALRAAGISTTAASSRPTEAGPPT